MNRFGSKIDAPSGGNSDARSKNKSEPDNSITRAITSDRSRMSSTTPTTFQWIWTWRLISVLEIKKTSVSYISDTFLSTPFSISCHHQYLSK